MSTFIVSKGHIDAILRAALAYSSDGITYYHLGTLHRMDFTNVETVGQMLVDEMVKSVAYEHRTEASDPGLPGPADKYWRDSYRYPPPGDRLPSEVEALKLVQCYQYQSCEHPDWDTSEAYAFCSALTLYLIHALPDYEAAAWEWRG